MMNYMTTKNYRPANLTNDMDKVFKQFFETAKTPVRAGFAVDVAEVEEGYSISADIPGFGAQDVDVRVEDNLLVIEAKELEKSDKKDDAEEKTTWYIRERRSGTLKRSFVLPEDVEKSGVEAEMKNGVLSVLLKKKPEAKPFNVKVQGK